MKRNTVALLGLLVVLLVVAYLVMQKPGEQSSSGSGALLAQIDSVSVDKIDIKSPTSHIVLEKQGAEWFLREPVNYKADQASVATLIHDTKSLEVRNVVSNKPEKFTVFQVDSATGTVFTLSEKGTQKVSLIVGKVGGTYTDLYIRKLPSNDVNAVDVSISYQLSRAPKEWRDKNIAAVPKESIKEIKYQYGDTVFTLAYKDSIWIIGKDVVKTEDVNGILSPLSNLQADDFIDSTLSPAPKINALISYGGVQLKFSFLKNQNKYAVQSSNSPQWFTMETWKSNSILKRKKDLVKPAK